MSKEIPTTHGATCPCSACAEAEAAAHRDNEFLIEAFIAALPDFVAQAIEDAADTAAWDLRHVRKADAQIARAQAWRLFREWVAATKQCPEL
jgi:hypothetical protein